MTSWADLDKLAVARPRADGQATLVARDDRAADAITGASNEARQLSVIVAIARVVRGRHVIAERHAGRGVVVYAATAAPAFLVDAVTAAGGVLFDGTREHVAPRPLDATVQLDGAFCDLASAVRRRLGVGTFRDALDVREDELRRRPIVDDASAKWIAVIELCALAGEAMRERRGARWIEAAAERLPLALEIAGERGEAPTLLFPAKLALAIVEGSAGSLRQLIALEERVGAGARGTGRAMPLLCKRTSVPLERLSWSTVVPADEDAPELPVIVWVEDHGEGVAYPTDRGPVSAEVRAEALANLDALEVEVTPLPLPFGKAALVTGDFFAAETVLAPSVMARVRRELGGPTTMLVATPERGHLLAIDASIAMIDDDAMAAFLVGVERSYERASERDQISTQVLVYVDRPIGRVHASPAARADEDAKA